MSPFFLRLAIAVLLDDQVVEEPAHDLRRTLLHIGGDVGVGVEREAGVGVTEDLRQRLGIHTARQRVGGEGVAQIVEADQRKLRTL